MTSKIVPGNDIASKIFKKVKTQLEKYKTKPELSVIIANRDPVINSFVKIKQSKAEELDIKFKKYILPPSITQEEFIKLLKTIKSDFIIVQLPIYKHLSPREILNTISVNKDLDILSEDAYNKFTNSKEIELEKIALPPVAGAIYEILKYYKIKIKDKTVLVIGQGKLVGQPAKQLMKILNANKILVADKGTSRESLEQMIKSADLIISGTGQPGIINCSQKFKKGVILLDAGTSTQKATDKLRGDIDTECEKIASIFAKVPGGIGPITIAKLFENILKLKK